LIDPNAKSKAFQYYKKAAELGHPNAQYNLGVFFERGIATDPDVEKAIFWYERAASTGLPQAAEAIRRLRAK
jgi:TPR repeat protein